MPGLMQGQQAFLNAVVQIVQGAEATQQIGTNDTRELAKKLTVGLLVTRLSTARANPTSALHLRLYPPAVPRTCIWRHGLKPRQAPP